MIYRDGAIPLFYCISHPAVKSLVRRVPYRTGPVPVFLIKEQWSYYRDKRTVLAYRYVSTKPQTKPQTKLTFNIVGYQLPY